VKSVHRELKNTITWKLELLVMAFDTICEKIDKFINNIIIYIYLFTCIQYIGTSTI